MGQPLQARPVFGLIGDMALAMKIVKAAKSYYLSVRNFDRAELLIQAARQERPCLVIVDCESREAETFQLLSRLKNEKEMEAVPVVGFVTAVKRKVGEEAQSAGCLRVYLKTEFLNQLESIFVRYAR